MMKTNFSNALNQTSAAINAASGVFRELTLPENSEQKDLRFCLCRYGEYPAEDTSGRTIMQVVDREAGEAMAANFNSGTQKLANFFRGVPIYEGHADDAGWLAKNPGHRASAVARIKTLEVAEDGIYATAAINSDGLKLLGGDAPKYTGQSPYWRLSEISGRKGCYRPILLWSVALTNNPNIMTNTIALNSLLGVADDTPSPAENGETENQENEMKLTPDALKALGFAPEAMPSEEEINAAIVKLASVKAEAETEKVAAEEETSAVNSRLSVVTQELDSVRSAAVETVIADAINSGRITEADKAQWTAALNTSFASESAKLKNLMPVLNTRSQLPTQGIRRDMAITDAANAAQSIADSVHAFAKEKGIDVSNNAGWDRAYNECRRAKPELFIK